MRISDWSSDVCSSDLRGLLPFSMAAAEDAAADDADEYERGGAAGQQAPAVRGKIRHERAPVRACWAWARPCDGRSEEHTSELQSLMRNSYAVCCLKKKKYTTQNIRHIIEVT